MGIKPGQIVDSFLVEGKKVVLRYPKLSDTKGVHKFFNKAITQSLSVGGQLSRLTPVTLKEEKQWVKEAVGKNKLKKAVYLLGVCNESVIASITIEKNSDQDSGHVGDFGIVLLEEFTGKGLGKKIANKIISIGEKDLKLNTITLHVFGRNKRAQLFYKKLGFKEFGRIRNGINIKDKYTDNIFMVKYLE